MDVVLRRGEPAVLLAEQRGLPGGPVRADRAGTEAEERRVQQVRGGDAVEVAPPREPLVEGAPRRGSETQRGQQRQGPPLARQRDHAGRGEREHARERPQRAERRALQQGRRGHPFADREAERGPEPRRREVGISQRPEARHPRPVLREDDERLEAAEPRERPERRPAVPLSCEEREEQERRAAVEEQRLQRGRVRQRGRTGEEQPGERPERRAGTGVAAHREGAGPRSGGAQQEEREDRPREQRRELRRAERLRQRRHEQQQKRRVEQGDEAPHARRLLLDVPPGAVMLNARSLWGRTGFDEGNEAWGACRGLLFLSKNGKTTQKPTTTLSSRWPPKTGPATDLRSPACGAGQVRQKSRLALRGAPTAQGEIHSEMVWREGCPCSARRMTINHGTSM